MEVVACWLSERLRESDRDGFFATAPGELRELISRLCVHLAGSAFVDYWG
jgi:hypothetical protein